MFHSVLVPLDGSTFGEHALPFALAVAHRARAALQVVHVCVPLASVCTEWVPQLDPTLEAALKDRGRAYLSTVVQRLSAASPVGVTAALLEGSVAATLEEQIAVRGADLVVMSRHGRSPLARAWLGSVADELIRRVSVPVLLVSPHEGLPNLTQEPSPRHLLIPLDGSLHAEQILEPAVRLGSLLGAEYTLIRVVPPVSAYSYDAAARALGPLDPRVIHDLLEIQIAEERQAQAYLERVATPLRACGLRVRTQLLVHANPALAVLAEAEAEPSGLVAMATHGRGGLSRLYRGSVTDKVLRSISLPVLVRRPPPQTQPSGHPALTTDSEERVHLDTLVP